MIVGSLRLAGVVIGLLLVAAVLAPLQLIVMVWAPRRRAVLPRLFHRAFLRLIRVRRTVHGAPAGAGVLYVSNHVSWTDIPLLGAVLGGVFVAKSEVASWPLVGALARLHGIIFVNRERARLAQDQAAAVADRLRDGEGVILFPEGTTSDGETLLPFKTSLFAAAQAEGEDIIIQPVSLAYTRVGGRALTAEDRQAVAWIGDDALVPHAARMLARPTLTAELVFHPPIHSKDFADRKALAGHCRAAIEAGLAALNRG